MPTPSGGGSHPPQLIVHTGLHQRQPDGNWLGSRGRRRQGRTGGIRLSPLPQPAMNSRAASDSHAASGPPARDRKCRSDRGATPRGAPAPMRPCRADARGAAGTKSPTGTARGGDGQRTSGRARRRAGPARTVDALQTARTAAAHALSGAQAGRTGSSLRGLPHPTPPASADQQPTRLTSARHRPPVSTSAHRHPQRYCNSCSASVPDLAARPDVPRRQSPRLGPGHRRPP